MPWKNYNPKIHTYNYQIKKSFNLYRDEDVIRPVGMISTNILKKDKMMDVIYTNIILQFKFKLSL